MADVNFKTTFGNDPNEEIAKDTSIIFVQQVLREYDSAPEFEGLKTNLLKLRETENLSIKDFNERYYNIVSDFYEKHYNDENMSEAMKKRLDVLYRYAEGLNSKDFKLNAKDFEFSVDEEHRKSAYISKQLGSNDAVAVVKPEAMNEILQEKRRLLDSVFDEVYSLMSGWSGVTLVQFIQSAVAQLPKQEKITLVLGEATASQLSQEDIHQLTSASELEVSKMTLKQKVGFVLQQSGIEYNYLFDALLKDLKQEYSPELAKKAFER